MTVQFQPPPTYADPFIKEPDSDIPKFNPIWLGWFQKLTTWINLNGGGGAVIDHNSLSGLQGGATAEYYHLTAARYTTLTGTQNKNTVFAGPAEGVASAAVFRALTREDLPQGWAIPGLDGQDGEDSLVPGQMGAMGVAGAMGAMGFDGLDGEEGLQGIPGQTGAQGPRGYSIPGMDGEDADNNFGGIPAGITFPIQTIWSRNSGIHTSLAGSYISGTGTSGTDNTAQTVVTVAIPANTLTQVGDMLQVRVYWTGTGGGSIIGTAAVGPAGSEVSVCAATDTGGASFYLDEAYVMYIDNTHANIIERDVVASSGLGTLSAVNVAGFTWNAAQNLIFKQNAVLGNHINVYEVIVNVIPKGI